MSPINHGTSSKQAYDNAAVSASITVDVDAKKLTLLTENQDTNRSSEVLRKVSPRRFNQLLQLYILTDLAALLLGFGLARRLASMINSYFTPTVAFPAVSQDMFSIVCYAVLAVGALFWFQHKGHYKVRMNFWQEAQNIINTFLIAMVAEGFLQFAAKNDFSRLWLISAWIFAAIASIGFRELFRSVLRRRGGWLVPTLLVGNGGTAVDTRAALNSESGLGYDIVAQLKNLPEAFMQAGRSWEKMCAIYGAEYVVIALDGAELEKAELPIAQLMRESVPFSISPPRRNLPVLDMVPQYFFNSDVKLLTHNSGLEQPLPRLIKRLFDIAVAGSALLVLSPIMIVLSVLVKRDGGPVFFGHKRIGKNGKTFYCLKFRSMVHNSQAVLEKLLASDPTAKAEWDATQKLKDDPRVTGFGNFLRSSSLDEIPQLLNVLRGEMSLVGPRPIVLDEVSKYNHDIAHYYRVSPGITGLWQVSGRNDVSYPQRVKMDSWYVRNWSLWHDIAILCKTFPALLKRSGAY